MRLERRSVPRYCMAARRSREPRLQAIRKIKTKEHNRERKGIPGSYLPKNAREHVFGLASNQVVT